MLNNNVDPILLEKNQRKNKQRYYLDLYLSDPQPNDEQKAIIEEIKAGMQSARYVIDGESREFATNIPRFFFITGEGGSGKTFTYNVS